ncbi:MAG: LysR family transcriptional regulator [Neisseriales bacterium]|nr:MAG: LysR family transcriptional regulator [Neisseriales bacterium]
MLDDIILFLDLYNSRNFSVTASALKMEASTLSRHIKNLEEKLGKQLIIRTSKTFEVTDFGNYIYNQFKHLPDFIDYTLARYNNIIQMDEIQGSVNLACGEEIAEKVITPRLPEFFAKYPNISLNISCVNNITKWPSEPIDIVLSPVYIKGNNLINRFVRTEYVQLFSSSDYAIKYGIPQKIEELKNHKIIGMVDDKLQPVDFVTIYNLNSKKEHLIDLRHNFLNINSSIQQYRIGNSLDYIFCTYKSIISSELKSGSVIPILPEWSFYDLNYHIVTNKKTSKEEDIVIDFLYQCLRLNY